MKTSPSYNLDTCLLYLARNLCRNGILATPWRNRKAYETTYGEIHARNSLREVTYDVVFSRTLSLCGHSLRPCDRTIVEAAEAFMKCWVRARNMEKGVPLILRRLGNKYTLGVVSNLAFSPAVRNTLERFWTANCFDAIIASADVGWCKPSPKIFKKALITLHISASGTVYVGDELDHDVEGAKKVGIRAILVKKPTTNLRTGKVKPYATIGHWRELPKPFESLA